MNGGMYEKCPTCGFATIDKKNMENVVEREQLTQLHDECWERVPRTEQATRRSG